MRIDQYTPTTETVQSGQVSGTSGEASSTSTASTTQTTQTNQTDGVSLRYQSLRAAVDNTPDVRQDRVTALQQAMQNGTYSVSNSDLANAMFNTLVQKS